MIAHPIRPIGSTGSLAASTEWAVSSTDVPLAFAMPPTESQGGAAFLIRNHSLRNTVPLLPHTNWTILCCASTLDSIYRWVVARFECPASIWISRNDPPTVEIFLAALVMKVRRPE